MPSPAEVASVIDNADMNTFVEDYVPNATPSTTVFANTIMVSTASGFDSRSGGLNDGSRGESHGERNSEDSG